MVDRRQVPQAMSPEAKELVCFLAGTVAGPGIVTGVACLYWRLWFRYGRP